MKCLQHEIGSGYLLEPVDVVAAQFRAMPHPARVLVQADGSGLHRRHQSVAAMVLSEKLLRGPCIEACIAANELAILLKLAPVCPPVSPASALLEYLERRAPRMNAEQCVMLGKHLPAMVPAAQLSGQLCAVLLGMAANAPVPALRAAAVYFARAEHACAALQADDERELVASIQSLLRFGAADARALALLPYKMWLLHTLAEPVIKQLHAGLCACHSEQQEDLSDDSGGSDSDEDHMPRSAARRAASLTRQDSTRSVLRGVPSTLEASVPHLWAVDAQLSASDMRAHVAWWLQCQASAHWSAALTGELDAQWRIARQACPELAELVLQGLACCNLGEAASGAPALCTHLVVLCTQVSSSTAAAAAVAIPTCNGGDIAPDSVMAQPALLDPGATLPGCHAALRRLLRCQLLTQASIARELVSIHSLGKPVAVAWMWLVKVLASQGDKGPPAESAAHQALAAAMLTSLLTHARLDAAATQFAAQAVQGLLRLPGTAQGELPSSCIVALAAIAQFTDQASSCRGMATALLGYASNMAEALARMPLWAAVSLHASVLQLHCTLQPARASAAGADDAGRALPRIWRACTPHIHRVHTALLSGSDLPTRSGVAGAMVLLVLLASQLPAAVIAHALESEGAAGAVLPTQVPDALNEDQSVALLFRVLYMLEDAVSQTPSIARAVFQTVRQLIGSSSTLASQPACSAQQALSTCTAAGWAMGGARIVQIGQALRMLPSSLPPSAGLASGPVLQVVYEWASRCLDTCFLVDTKAVADVPVNAASLVQAPIAVAEFLAVATESDMQRVKRTLVGGGYTPLLLAAAVTAEHSAAPHFAIELLSGARRVAALLHSTPAAAAKAGVKRPRMALHAPLEFSGSLSPLALPALASLALELQGATGVQGMCPADMLQAPLLLPNPAALPLQPHSADATTLVIALASAVVWCRAMLCVAAGQAHQVWVQQCMAARFSASLALEAALQRCVAVYSMSIRGFDARAMLCDSCTCPDSQALLSWTNRGAWLPKALLPSTADALQELQQAQGPAAPAASISGQAERAQRSSSSCLTSAAKAWKAAAAQLPGITYQAALALLGTPAITWGAEGMPIDAIAMAVGVLHDIASDCLGAHIIVPAKKLPRGAELAAALLQPNVANPDLTNFALLHQVYRAAQHALHLMPVATLTEGCLQAALCSDDLHVMFSMGADAERRIVPLASQVLLHVARVVSATVGALAPSEIPQFVQAATSTAAAPSPAQPGDPAQAVQFWLPDVHTAPNVATALACCVAAWNVWQATRDAANAGLLHGEGLHELPALLSDTVLAVLRKDWGAAIPAGMASKAAKLLVLCADQHTRADLMQAIEQAEINRQPHVEGMPCCKSASALKLYALLLDGMPSVLQQQLDSRNFDPEAISLSMRKVAEWLRLVKLRIDFCGKSTDRVVQKAALRLYNQLFKLILRWGTGLRVGLQSSPADAQGVLRGMKNVIVQFGKIHGELHGQGDLSIVRPLMQVKGLCDRCVDKLRSVCIAAGFSDMFSVGVLKLKSVHGQALGDVIGPAEEAEELDSD